MLVLGGPPSYHNKLNIFGYGPRTLGKTEDYPSRPGDYPNSGGSWSTIPKNHYWCEEDVSYIKSYGSMFDDTYPLTFEYDTKIGNHYWYTAIYGTDVKNTPPDYCPIYPPVESITFDYIKTENTGTSGRHAFRVYKIGAVERTSNSSLSIRDLSTISSTGQSKLFSFTSAGTFKGSYTMGISGSTINHPVGFYFQLETEGNHTGGVNGNKIEIYNLTFKFKNNNDKYYILPKMKTYSTKNPPDKYYIQT